MTAGQADQPSRSRPPAEQSLSPFESRTTTMVVWWSLLVICIAALVVCWTLWF